MINKQNLPPYFKSILWSYDFSKVDPERYKRRIIVNTINHGMWKHWDWVFNYYGKEDLRDFIKEVSKSEFRKTAIKLFYLLLGISLDDLKHETRAEYVHEQVT